MFPSLSLLLWEEQGDNLTMTYSTKYLAESLSCILGYALVEDVEGRTLRLIPIYILMFNKSTFHINLINVFNLMS